MLAVFAKLRVTEGRGPELEAAFKDLAVGVRAEEPGCLLYELTLVRGETAVYRTLELYQSQADFDQHGQTPHFKAHYPRMRACYAEKPEVEFLDGIEAARKPAVTP